MDLNYEIQQLLASFNTPLPIAEKIARMCDQLEQDRIAPGIEVGAAAPDFSLPDDAGGSVRLSDQLRSGPVVVTFFRGAWCPVCNLQVAALLRALPQIRSSGGVLLGIHPDIGQFRGEALPEGFRLLTDADQAVIQSYRLQFSVPADVRRIYIGDLDLDISKQNLDGSWNLPVPGTFVLDPTGIVRRRHVTADFTQRMEPDDLVAALEEIRQTASA